MFSQRRFQNVMKDFQESVFTTKLKTFDDVLKTFLKHLFVGWEITLFIKSHNEAIHVQTILKPK